MAAHKVVITMNNRPPSDITLDVIKNAGIDVQYVSCDTEDQVITAARDADVLLVGTVPLHAVVLYGLSARWSLVAQCM
jgi:hypothetical protein